jgi:hypothetical protein
MRHGYAGHASNVLLPSECARGRFRGPSRSSEETCPR